ncbi:MAG TPA: DUF6265 family protein [Allosphingosinicella sp.]
MTKGVKIAVALLLSISANALAQDLSTLEWMSGEWEQTPLSVDGPHVLGWTVENWSRPRGGVMLGNILTGRREGDIITRTPVDSAEDFKFVRIARTVEGGTAFYASADGGAPVAFQLTSAGPDNVTFENAQHDYPQRITYRRAGDILTTTISLGDGSRPMSRTYRRVN